MRPGIILHEQLSLSKSQYFTKCTITSQAATISLILPFPGQVNTLYLNFSKVSLWNLLGKSDIYFVTIALFSLHASNVRQTSC